MAEGSETGRVLRSPREIALMRRAGLVVWYAHQAAARLIRPGITTAGLDAAIAGVFDSFRATPLFLNYPGKHSPFPAVSCISINEEVVHGIPGTRQLVEGDIVSIDTGCRLNGWCGDAAVTHEVGTVSPSARKLLQVTSAALDTACQQMASSERWSQVAREMQKVVELAGFSVIRDMVGHAIGQEMHEKPQVPNYFSPEWAAKGDFQLRPGVVLAVEPMVAAGKWQLRTLADHWTTVTADQSLSAHFEHTLALTGNGVRRLTGPPETDEELDGTPQEFRDQTKWVVW
jgi:methionyl aminopeptidase